VVAKVRKGLAMSKQITLRVHTERFSLKKLNKVEGNEQYDVEMANRFASLEILEAEVDINGAWETMRENIKILTKECLGYYELKKLKP
jgi:lysyl-tRNA synthetase class II